MYPDPEAIRRATGVLRNARRPVMVIGGGVITGQATDEVLALATQWKIPVVTTWNGKSGFPEDNELFAGSVGQTGTPCGNKVASSADVVIAVGVPIHRLVLVELCEGDYLFDPAGAPDPHRRRPA